MIRDILTNPYLLLGSYSLLSAQLAKYILTLVQRRPQLSRLWDLDSAPNTWISYFASLVTIAWGVDSFRGIHLWLLAFWLMTLLLIQPINHLRPNRISLLLHRLINRLPVIRGLSIFKAEPLAKWTGFGYGLMVGLAVSVAYWKQRAAWMAQPPTNDESRLYVYAFLAVIVLIEVLLWRLRRSKYRRLPSLKAVRSAIRYTVGTPALVGLFFALLQNQTRNVTLTDRYFTYLIVFWIIAGNIWAYVSVYRGIRNRLSQEKDRYDRDNKPRKRRKRSRNRH